MYSGFPAWAHHAVKIALAGGWACLVGAGASALINPNPAITDFIDWWRLVVAAGLVIAGMLAVWSVATERYRGEWVASWVSAMCLTPYAVIAWAAATASGYYAGAWLFTALIFVILSRGLFCSGFAGKLRDEHLARENRDRDDTGVNE